VTPGDTKAGLQPLALGAPWGRVPGTPSPRRENMGSIDYSIEKAGEPPFWPCAAGTTSTARNLDRTGRPTSNVRSGWGSGGERRGAPGCHPRPPRYPIRPMPAPTLRHSHTSAFTHFGHSLATAGGSDQWPVQFGLRFSKKASRASLASSDFDSATVIPCSNR
jgi:hypothetical protein